MAFAAAAALAAITCGGSTEVETVVGPDPVRCTTALSGPSSMVPANGGSVNVTVTASRDCTWSASAESSWLQLNATSGQGNSTLAVTVARNDLPSTRNGAVTVNDQRYTVSQEAQPCTYELRGPGERLSAAGGRTSVRVETAAGCTWTANSSAVWLRVLTPSGNGAGTVELEADANTGSTREATVTIGDRRATIVQSDPAQSPPPPNCGATFTPPTISAPAAGGTHTLTVGIGPACDWNASSSASWLTITSASSGRGPGSLTLSTTRNSGAARSASITIGTQSAQVNQAAAPACTVTIDPTSQSFPAAGGDGRVRVNTQEGCEWTASGGASWIRITTDRGGPGGELRYTVNANTATTSRAATITVGGVNHNVTQSAAAPTCTYALDPGSRTFPAAGGEGTVTVNTQQGCTWTPSNVPSWVTVNGGTGQRTGSGPLSYNVQANSTTTARNGSISIAGQSHGISQEAMAAPTCTYAVQPPAQTVGAGAGEARFTVVTQQGCAWQAQSGAAWAAVTTPSGSGQSEIVFTVQANPGPGNRSTSITVNGQAHTVTQDAPAPTCTYAVQPASSSHPAAGGSGSFDVVTQQGCTWTAGSSADWAMVATPSGTGPGPVSFSVQANPAASPRSAAITVNGQAHTVNQQAAAPTCTYSLNPTAATIPAGGGTGRFTVNTQPSCTWTASSGQSWAVVTTPAGSGTSEVSYTVEPNSGTTPRQATITVNGQSHTVTQDAPPAPPVCTYSIDPSQRDFPARGGTGSVRVTTGPTCTWTASSPVGWIVLASSGGTGSQDVSYTVAENDDDDDDREATLTIAGQGHRVRQEEGDDDDDDDDDTGGQRHH